jgi:hypothetical protein
MCGGCRVKIGQGIKFACVDGPDFDAHQVDFDDLIARLARFRQTEQAALRKWEESCRMRVEGDAAVPSAPSLRGRSPE